MDTESAVDLRLTLIIFPDNTELDDALRDLHYSECFFVCRVFFEERGQAGSQLVQCLFIIKSRSGVIFNTLRGQYTCSNSGSEGRTIVDLGGRWSEGKKRKSLGIHRVKSGGSYMFPERP